MKVLHPKNLPTRLPITTTTVAWLALDRLHAPQWLWASTATVGALLWIAAVMLLFKETRVRLWPEDKKDA